MCCWLKHGWEEEQQSAPRHRIDELILRMHRELWKKRGLSMPVAAVIGPTPNIGMVAVTRVPYGVSEYDVAGGIAGEPVSLVKCKSIDLEVPATAEVVIEATEKVTRQGTRQPEGALIINE